MKTKLLITLLTLMTANTYAVEVTKQDWIAGMNNALPSVFCEASTYFRQCFDASAEKCQEITASATQKCLTKNADDIPNTLTQPEDAQHWGTIIGSCAGEAYEMTLAKQKIANEKCDDIDNWK